MGRVPSFNRQYEVSHMWERHHEIVRLALLGNKNVEIAEKLNCTPQNISDCLNSKIVRDKLQILRAERDSSTVDVAAAIKNLAPRAVELVDKIMNAEIGGGVIKPELQFKAAMDVLDRNGYAAPKTIRTENIHGVFSRDDLEEMKKQAHQLAIENNMIDAEIVDEY